MNYFLCNCTCHSSYFTVLLYMRIIYENLVVVVVVVLVVVVVVLVDPIIVLLVIVPVSLICLRIRLCASLLMIDL